MESILTSIKKLLGIDDEYEAFDPDIIIHINSVFSVLNQLGVGPEDGFSIEDKGAKWVEFIGDSRILELVKSYMYLKVRLMFDPPSSTTLVDSMNRMINEYEWRLNVAVDPGEKSTARFNLKITRGGGGMMYNTHKNMS